MKYLAILLLSVAAFGQVASIQGRVALKGQVVITQLSQPGSHTVVLSWQPSTTPGVSYNVYRGTVSGGPYQKIASSVAADSYTDQIQLSTFSYFYVVTSFDGTNESVFSNEAHASK